MGNRDNYLVFQDGGVPIKAWVKGVHLEEQARQQLINVSKMPFLYKWVSVLPDVHWGMGATVGSVIPTKGAIIPAAVGVDIGCGMCALQTDIKAEELPDDLGGIRSAIESSVPHGRTDNGGPNDRGAWSVPPTENALVFDSKLRAGYKKIISKYPKIDRNASPINHLATLGTGNHFIEICLDTKGHVWIMLHSGSRGIGNRIGMYFIQKAKEDMKRYFINVPDQDLAYLPEGTDHFDDYVEAVSWAQEFARSNRELMLLYVSRALANIVRPFKALQEAVNCHHNYVAREYHYGKNVWVTRKGAVRARKGDLGIIPGSMGARSYIVRGKGSQDSFHSCSHGAGRMMSRSEAKKRFTVEEHIAATEGIECRKDEDVIDETPAAYKDIDAVMAAQKDLVEVVHELRQVVCVKG